MASAVVVVLLLQLPAALSCSCRLSRGGVLVWRGPGDWGALGGEEGLWGRCECLQLDRSLLWLMRHGVEVVEGLGVAVGGSQVSYVWMQLQCCFLWLRRHMVEAGEDPEVGGAVWKPGLPAWMESRPVVGVPGKGRVCLPLTLTRCWESCIACHSHPAAALMLPLLLLHPGPAGSGTELLLLLLHGCQYQLQPRWWWWQASALPCRAWKHLTSRQPAEGLLLKPS